MAAIWAISDLHLNLAETAPRHVTPPRWRDHVGRIESEWRACVHATDLVLIPGDISLAGNHRDVQADLAWLGELPGTKVLSPGNHDRWWGRVERVRPLLRLSMFAVEGDALCVNGVVVCGARGAPADEASRGFEAELDNLERALDQAGGLRSAGEPLFVLWHFPPFDKFGRSSSVVERLIEARATACIYGHLHQMSQWSTATHGMFGGVRFYCVAADAVGFRPLLIGAAAKTG